ERHDNDRLEVGLPNFLQLAPSLLEIMGGVCIGRLFGQSAIVKVFVITATGNAVVLDADKFSLAACDKIDIFWRKIEADVAVEISICWIARIALLCAPNLAARFPVAPKDRRASGREIRCVDRPAGSRLAKHHAVGVEDRPAHVPFLQKNIDSRSVSAL